LSKLIIGLVAVPVIAVCGFFGAEAYLQHRIAGEIEANFEQIRATGGQAKRGDIAFSLWHRSIAIADIAVEFGAPQPATIKVGRFAASGIGLNSATTFTADSVVLTDIETGGSAATSAGLNVSIKVPRLEISDYAGPTRLQGEIKTSSAIDMYRAALQQFAAVKARAITAPRMTVTANGAALSGGAEYVYSDVTASDIKDGKIAAMNAARGNVSVAIAQAGKSVRMTGEVADIAGRDFDTAAAAIVLDPAHADDANFYRIQGPMTVGAYTVKSADGLAFHIDSMRVGDTRIQPSSFRLQELLAVLPPPGTTPDAAKSRLLIETAAKIYEGIKIDDAEIRGMSIDGPGGPVKLAAIRMNLDRGKFGEFAFEGLDGTSPEGPFKIGRFALKGFNFSGMMRQISQITASGKSPAIDGLISMLQAFEGVEIKDVTAPYKGSKQLVHIENASLDWGQFVGPIPSKAHLTLKITGPIEDKDGEPFATLREAGLDHATVGADIGLGWDESTRKLSLAPGALDISGLFAMTVETSLDNVERRLFSTNPQQIAVTSMLVKPGALTVTLRDLGGLDLAIAQHARRQGSTPETVRGALLADIQSNAQIMADSNAAAGKVAAAAAAFIEKPHSTLTLHVTPNQSMPLLQMIEMMKTSGPAALSLFDVEAQTGP
jgi:hypothetical protein